jgi:2'-5' RNA ligase
MQVMEQIRSFIAIELPRSVKTAISQLQEKLKTGSRAPVKWVRPDNTHLTLKFLGDIDVPAVGNIHYALKEAAGGITTIRLGVSGLGTFPNNNRVQIIWVGLTGELDKLRKLQEHIDRVLAPLGFPAEKRGFSPHLTIARLRNQATVDERQDMGRLIATSDFESNLEFGVKSVSLMKSQLTREGPIYSLLGAANLG